MQDYQHQFIEFCLHHQVLRFGEFTLKSGRISPYFFNAGLFNTGSAIAKLGEFYAKAIENANLDYDMIFGPAYKGIPLVVSTAIALTSLQQQDLPYAFNRKEAKDHGEGGMIVGHPLEGKVLIVDDVITAGTAIGESMSLLEKEKAPAAGIIIAMDRQERGQGDKSAIAEIEENYKVPVISIIKLKNLLEYLQEDRHNRKHLAALKEYRDKFGV